MFLKRHHTIRLTALIISLSLFVPMSAGAQINNLKSGELLYTLRGTGPDYQLLISPAKGLSSLSRNLTANVFSVKNPSRLVVDLPGFSKGSSKEVSLSDGNLSGLRLGIHKDKTRIVLDIKDNRIPVYDVSADPTIGALVVSFALSSPNSQPTMQTAMKQTAEPRTVQPQDLSQTSQATSIGGKPIQIQQTVSDPIPLPKVETEKTPVEMPKVGEPLDAKKPSMSKGTIVVEANENEVSIKRPQVVAAKKSTDPKLSDNAAGTLVQGILFQAPKDSPLGALVVEGKKLDTYSLNQKGPNLYELIVKDAQLDGQHLTLPQFPPESFKGFEVVLSNQVDSDVVVKIYVNDGIKLAPYVAKGKLWIKASGS